MGRPGKLVSLLTYAFESVTNIRDICTNFRESIGTVHDDNMNIRDRCLNWHWHAWHFFFFFYGGRTCMLRKERKMYNFLTVKRFSNVSEEENG